MSFLLLFPGRTTDSAGCLRDAGLEDFVGGETQKPVTGPDGRRGLLIGWGLDLAIDTAKQRWVAEGNYFIGFPSDRNFDPEQLRRRAAFQGRTISLSDGSQWLIPAAADLPMGLKLVDGQWTKVRKPQFQEFWNQSEIWFKRFMELNLDEGRMQIESNLTREQFLQEWANYCVFAIRQNYRVTPRIFSELVEFDTEDLFAITLATLDADAIREALKELQDAIEKESSGLPKKDEASECPDT
jgi:hypothetical protein